MKYEIRVRKTVRAKYVKIQAAVRYDDDDMPYDAPLRRRDMWNAMVDLDTQTIENWPIGKTLEFHMKVCDQGTYILYDKDRREITRINNNYVPNSLLPGSYGDYLELDIDVNGKIVNWLRDADLSDFEKDDE